MESDFEHLIDRAKSGDEQALLDLFTQNRDRLQRMVRVRMDRRIQSQVDVSDVLQEAYVDLARQLPNYVKDSRLPFFLWMRRITGQRLAKCHQFYLGRQKRNVSREVALDRSPVPDASSVVAASELAGQFTSAAGRAIREETRLLVQEALDSLPEPDREIIVLRNVEQLTTDETALILDITSKAAGMRYIRAIVRLKAGLAKIPGLID